MMAIVATSIYPQNVCGIIVRAALQSAQCNELMGQERDEDEQAEDKEAS